MMPVNNEGVAMSEDTPTWRRAKADAEAAAVEWWGELDDHDRETCEPNEAAHEYADGCSDVIYTNDARTIWMDSPEVRKWEDEADGILGGSEGSADIDRRITLCVYFAVRFAFESKAQTLFDEWDECRDEKGAA